MPEHRYKCKKGHRTNRFFKVADIAKSIECPRCGAEAPQDWSFFAEGIGHNWAMSTNGYDKGVDPQTGVSYENYSHKKQVLREQGKVEGDVKRIDDIMQEQHDEEQRQKAARDVPMETLRADSEEELMKKVREMGHFDAARSGDLSRQTALDPGL